jgi:phosphatidate cytidylyltransferase
MSSSGKWSDLRTRLLSGGVVLVIGLGAVWSGGLALMLLAVAVAGLALWELVRLTDPAPTQRPVLIGLVAAGVIALVLYLHWPTWLLALALPSVLGLVGPRRDRVIFALYAFLIMLAVYGFVAFREGYGLPFALWLVGIVIASDVMGYFGGRMLGGPKFWPRLSPKKTWSGTVAGWVGAGLVGLIFAVMYAQPLSLILFSALTAFAAQMGDIFESAVKRRAGVKDSSNLIPGHGGLLDRFDALIGAAVFVLVWGALNLPLPIFTG